MSLIEFLLRLIFKSLLSKLLSSLFSTNNSSYESSYSLSECSVSSSFSVSFVSFNDSSIWLISSVILFDKVIPLDNLYNEYDKSEADTDYSTNSDGNNNYLTGLFENETFINITNFELGNLEGVKAKLEGSQIRKLKNYFFNINYII